MYWKSDQCVADFTEAYGQDTVGSQGIFSYLENTDKPCVCTIAKFGAECHTASFETSDDHLSYRRQDKGVFRIRSLSSDVDRTEVLIHLNSLCSWAFKNTYRKTPSEFRASLKDKNND